MLELQTLMAEEFRKLYPQVKIQVEGKGSSTAPPALIEGTVQLGNMSRKMKNKETDAFEEAFGYEPDPLRRRPRHPGGLRQQGQPHREPDHPAGRRDLLQDPQVRLRG